MSQTHTLMQEMMLMEQEYGKMQETNQPLERTNQDRTNEMASDKEYFIVIEHFFLDREKVEQSLQELRYDKNSDKLCYWPRDFLSGNVERPVIKLVQQKVLKTLTKRRIHGQEILKLLSKRVDTQKSESEVNVMKYAKKAGRKRGNLFRYLENKGKLKSSVLILKIDNTIDKNGKTRKKIKNLVKKEMRTGVNKEDGFGREKDDPEEISGADTNMKEADESKLTEENWSEEDDGQDNGHEEDGFDRERDNPGEISGADTNMTEADEKLTEENWSEEDNEQENSHKEDGFDRERDNPEEISGADTNMTEADESKLTEENWSDEDSGKENSKKNYNEEKLGKCTGPCTSKCYGPLSIVSQDLLLSSDSQEEDAPVVAEKQVRSPLERTLQEVRAREHPSSCEGVDLPARKLPRQEDIKKRPIGANKDPVSPFKQPSSLHETGASVVAEETNGPSIPPPVNERSHADDLGHGNIPGQANLLKAVEKLQGNVAGIEKHLQAISLSLKILAHGTAKNLVRRPSDETEAPAKRFKVADSLPANTKVDDMRRLKMLAIHREILLKVLNYDVGMLKQFLAWKNSKATNSQLKPSTSSS